MVAGDVDEHRGAPPGRRSAERHPRRRARRSGRPTRAIEYREAEPVTAKGKAEPVPRLARARSRDRASAIDLVQPAARALVGRERELDLLARRARARPARTRDAAARDPRRRARNRQVPTRLRALRRSSTRDPELIYWRQGRSPALRRRASRFWALGEMAKAHAGILESDSSAECGGRSSSRAVAELLAGRATRRLGRSDISVRSSGSAAEADASAERRQRGVRRLAPLLRGARRASARSCSSSRISTGPTTACSTSSTSSPTWVSDVPLLVLCYGPAGAARAASRAGVAGSATRRPSRSRRSRTTRLRVCSPRSSTGRCSRPRRRPRCSQRAGGNPLYAEEYVRMLRDRRRRRARRSRRRSRASSRPGSTRCSRRREGAAPGRGRPRQGLLDRTRSPSLGGTRVARRSRSVCTRSSARSSSAASGGRPSPARRSTRSGTCSSATSPTARCRGRARRTGTGGPPSGSSRSPTTAPRTASEMLAHHYLAALEYARSAGRRRRRARRPRSPPRSSEAGERAFALQRVRRRRRVTTRSALELGRATTRSVCWPMGGLLSISARARRGGALEGGRGGASPSATRRRRLRRPRSSSASLSLASAATATLRPQSLRACGRARRGSSRLPRSKACRHEQRLSLPHARRTERRSDPDRAAKRSRWRSELGLDERAAHALNNIGAGEGEHRRPLAARRTRRASIDIALSSSTHPRHAAGYNNLGSLILSRSGTFRARMRAPPRGRSRSRSASELARGRLLGAEPSSRSTSTTRVAGTKRSSARRADRGVAAGGNRRLHGDELPRRPARDTFSRAVTSSGAVADAIAAPRARAPEIKDPQVL